MFKFSSLFIFYSQSFLDLEYAILEVGVEETTTVENKNIYKFSHRKIHPRKKKKRKREANCAETKIQQLTTAESFQPPCKIASLAEPMPSPCYKVTFYQHFQTLHQVLTLYQMRNRLNTLRDVKR